MKGRKDGFTRGHTTFKCQVCTRLTRETHGNGTECCPQCFEIAGLDNQVNDSGEPLPADVLADCESYLKEIIAKGGNGAEVKRCNTFIWPGEKNARDTD
jgi:hypothetical protein